MLEIVNDQDEVIGIESRTKIHAEGLLHREIHVWFVTPNKEIILQHRSKDKDTFPDLLDATVGGQVEIGMTYEATVIKETLEETGIMIDQNKLHFIEKLKLRSVDSVTKAINNAFRNQYFYEYSGDISSLHIENGKATGFVKWPLVRLINMTDADKSLVIPTFTTPEFRRIYKNINASI